MKIEKLPSGNYRIRKMYKSQTYTVVFDCKPTQKEAMQAMAKELDKVQGKNKSKTLRKTTEDYVNMKRNILSPHTIKEYAEMANRFPEWFCSLHVADITQVEDISGDTVHITKTLVLDENRNWIIKTNKTTETTRDIIVPGELAEKIRSQGYVYKGHPENITKCLERTEEKLVIPKFPLHKLRHYFASQMSALGVPDADILRMGGWETDHVMDGTFLYSKYKQKTADFH